MGEEVIIIIDLDNCTKVVKCVSKWEGSSTKEEPPMIGVQLCNHNTNMWEFALGQTNKSSKYVATSITCL
jgi:Tfp pilus assembly protein PilZ